MAGFSQELMYLIAFKVLQGVGAAMLFANSMSIVTTVFPDRERGKALGLHMTVVGLGGISGPVIGGLLVNSLGWRWVLFINVPVGILGTAAALMILDSRLLNRGQPKTVRQAFDWLGASLSAATLIAILLTVTNGHRFGWSSAPILAGLSTFLALLVTFIWWELRASEPMLDLKFFRNRLFSFGVTAGFIAFLGMSSIGFLIPFYLQGVLGYNPQVAGLIIMPSALSMALVGPLSGSLSDRFGWRRFNVAGLAILGCSLLILSRATENSSLNPLILALILQGVGFGLFQSPNNSSILSTVERAKYGVATAFVTLMRNTSGAIGIAIATTIVAVTMESLGYEPSLSAVSSGQDIGTMRAFTQGMRLVFLIVAGLMALGIILSFLKGGSTRKVPEALPELPTFATKAHP